MKHKCTTIPQDEEIMLSRQALSTKLLDTAQIARE
jgi:hypothetical protein